MKDVNDFLLTKSITVGNARQWTKDRDDNAKLNLIRLIDHRFSNRYLKHIKTIDSGFLKMAISCLMIETLESFKQGRKDTNGKSAQMFRDFFSTEKAYFPGFSDICQDFYSSIRCGILHQAETINAWRILPSGDILDTSGRSINSLKFVESLELSLNSYIKNLEQDHFDSLLWSNALIKIKDICDNCEVK